jgi:hypothetical protein
VTLPLFSRRRSTRKKAEASMSDRKTRTSQKAAAAGTADRTITTSNTSATHCAAESTEFRTGSNSLFSATSARPSAELAASDDSPAPSQPLLANPTEVAAVQVPPVAPLATVETPLAMVDEAPMSLERMLILQAQATQAFQQRMEMAHLELRREQQQFQHAQQLQAAEAAAQAQVRHDALQRQTYLAAAAAEARQAEIQEQQVAAAT